MPWYTQLALLWLAWVIGHHTWRIAHALEAILAMYRAAGYGPAEGVLVSSDDPTPPID